MEPVLSQWENAQRELIERLHREKQFRPTVVITLVNQFGGCFIGKQNNPEGNWSLPQEGIERGETVIEAGLRGLSEEMGIESRHILEIVNLDLKMLIHFPKDRQDKRGFTDGKLYFCIGVTVQLGGESDLVEMMAAHVGQGLEITQGTWEHPEAAIRRCILQPEVPAATEATRDKGRKVLRPAIRAMVDFQFEKELASLLA